MIHHSGNAAEHVTSVWMAMKNKVGLAPPALLTTC
jgi:Ca2+/H+ antiporter